MAIPLALLLFISGSALLTVGVVFACTRKNRMWHIMTGSGAALLITGIVLLFIIATGISDMARTDSYNNSYSFSESFISDENTDNYHNGYRQGYSDGYSDGLNAASEALGSDDEISPEKNGRYHNNYDSLQPSAESSYKQDSNYVPDNESNPQADDDYFIGDFIAELLDRIFNSPTAQ